MQGQYYVGSVKNVTFAAYDIFLCNMLLQAVLVFPETKFTDTIWEIFYWFGPFSDSFALMYIYQTTF